MNLWILQFHTGNNFHNKFRFLENSILQPNSESHSIIEMILGRAEHYVWVHVTLILCMEYKPHQSPYRLPDSVTECDLVLHVITKTWDFGGAADGSATLVDITLHQHCADSIVTHIICLLRSHCDMHSSSFLCKDRGYICKQNRSPLSWMWVTYKNCISTLKCCAISICYFALLAD